MLITFHSPAAASITMFGDVAKRLLVMMGQSGATPGALLAADVPAALERLKRAVAKEETATKKTAGGAPLPTPAEEEREREQGPHISIVTRAVPLIQFLEEAVAAKADVTWGM